MQRTSWRVALAALVALLAGACGGDDDGETGDASADAGEESVLEVEEEPSPPPEPEPVEYEVQEGDTLSSIASDHDVTIDDIVAANDLDDPDAIYPGDVLEIPDPADDAVDADDAVEQDADDGAGDDPVEDPDDADDD